MSDDDGLSWNEKAIRDLRHHWGTAYDIWYTADWFYARSKSGGKTLSAPSASKLRQLIYADYPQPGDGGSL